MRLKKFSESQLRLFGVPSWVTSYLTNYLVIKVREYV